MAFLLRPWRPGSTLADTGCRGSDDTVIGQDLGTPETTTKAEGRVPHGASPSGPLHLRPTSSIYSFIQMSICAPISTAALFQPAKRWKQPKGPLATEEWINKIWSVDTLGCYSALKHTGILTHATARISLEDIRLGEMNQSQKDKYRRIPCI